MFKINNLILILYKLLKPNLLLTTLLLSCFFIFTADKVSAYAPPIGIPDPGMWGTTHPVDSTAPDTATKCPSWPSATTTDCYYVDNSGTCSDTSNTYGYPNNPRCTIPSQTSYHVYAAGTYFEVHGGPYTSNLNLRFEGTAESPCWFRGFSPSVRPLFTNQILLKNSSYLFVENLNFDGGQNSCISLAGDSTNHVTIRNSNFSNRIFNAQATSAVGGGPSQGNSIHDFIYYNNTFSELGNWQALEDDDFHGISVSIDSSRTPPTELYNVWILNNSFYHLSGNGVQVNAFSYTKDDYLHHVYAGFNTGHANRQSVLWSKQGSDIIFSQNTTFDSRSHGSQPGDGIGFQYGPNNLWIIFNDIYDSNHGVRQSSTSTLEGGTDDIYILGNKIHSINPEDPAGNYLVVDYYKNGTGIALTTGGGPTYTRHIVDNTIYDAWCGIAINQNAPVEIDGNIIAEINDTYTDGSGNIDYHVMNNQDATSITATRNLFYSSVAPFRFRWSSATYTTIAALQSAKATGTDCLVDDPLFENAAGEDFHLQSSSPAIGVAPKNSAYDIFEARYGISIDVDYDGNSRPLTNRTLGAFEYNSEYLPDNTAPTAPIGLSVL